jgi:hypothetical protein
LADFLKFRNQHRFQAILGLTHLTNLFAEFVEEDRDLAKTKF